ncbi:uncharacterized protein [Salminus brasiliensis]|uniref:uncharacterized protein n=1 Tax=Salminus brasiliensis TaxID=930266 RepID=UPI003B834EC4
MAACELKGELKYRDGQTKTFTVRTENNLKSVISSVKKLSSDVSEVLTSLVEQEKCLTASGNGDSRVDGEEEEEEEEGDGDEQDDVEETAVLKSNSGGPPAKRLKASKS